MIEVHPKEIAGSWTKGFALDEQTLSSEYAGEGEFGRPQFDTERSEMGQLLYRLKSQGDPSVLEMIVNTVSDFVRSRDLPVDLVVPVPPSRANRSIPPPLAVAEGVAARLGIPLCSDCVVKVKQTPELKNVRERSKRQKLLENAFRAGGPDLAGKKVLLIDDLYRSGATLSAVTSALYEGGKAEEVYVVTLTRTRRLR